MSTTPLENLNNLIKDDVIRNFKKFLTIRLEYDCLCNSDVIKMSDVMEDLIEEHYHHFDDYLELNEDIKEEFFDNLTFRETMKITHEVMSWSALTGTDHLIPEEDDEEEEEYMNKIMNAYWNKKGQDYINEFDYGCDLEFEGYEGSHYEQWNKLEKIFYNIVKKEKINQKFKTLYYYAYKLEIKNELMQTKLTEDIIDKVIKNL